MSKIHKQVLALEPSQVIEVPFGAQILTIQAQGEDIVVWYSCNPDRQLQQRAIVLVGTGHDLPDTHTLKYISTVQQGEFVWHFYEAVQ